MRTRQRNQSPDVLRLIAPRKVLLAAPRGEAGRRLPSVHVTEQRFTREPGLLAEWLAKELSVTGWPVGKWIQPKSVESRFLTST